MTRPTRRKIKSKMSITVLTSKAKSLLHSTQVGIDRAIIGYRVELPGLSITDAPALRESLAGFLGEEFKATGMGYQLPIRGFDKTNATNPRTLVRQVVFMSKQFRSAGEGKKPVVHFNIMVDLSVIREIAFREKLRMKPQDRTRLEDFYLSFSKKRNGQNDNKFPVNAVNPRISAKSFQLKQWGVLRRLEKQLQITMQEVTTTIQSIYPTQKIQFRPVVHRLEVAQDIYFYAPKKLDPPLIFERMAFVGRLIQDHLARVSGGALVTRYPRALTEYDFRRNPIRRISYRHDRERQLQLRSSQNYTVEAVTNWIKRKVVPSLYFLSPQNLKDTLPDTIPIHAYTDLLMPKAGRCDLFRVEPRFHGRLGLPGTCLTSLIRKLHGRALLVLPNEADLDLIQTQRPLVAHRLLHAAGRTIGLTLDEIRVLCKGGSIRPNKRRVDFGEFKTFFEVCGKSR